MPVRSRPWRIPPGTTGVRMERRWGVEACWCGRVRAQAKRSTPERRRRSLEPSNEPQAGGFMTEWNARPTIAVYCVTFHMYNNMYIVQQHVSHVHAAVHCHVHVSGGEAHPNPSPDPMPDPARPRDPGSYGLLWARRPRPPSSPTVAPTATLLHLLLASTRVVIYRTLPVSIT